MYQIKSEWDSTVETKKFTDEGNDHFYVRIYIDANPEELDNIQLVKYTLHPTFTDRVRVSEDRAMNFEIRIWTYGYFDLVALLIMKDGTTQEVPGYVRWEVPVPIASGVAPGGSAPPATTASSEASTAAAPTDTTAATPADTTPTTVADASPENRTGT